MNKKGFGFLFYILILTALTIGFAVNYNENFNLDSFRNDLNWTHVNISVEEAPDLGDGLESLINGVGDALISFIKFVAQWSLENPEVPYKLLIFGILLAILLPILYYLGMGIIILVILIKEWIKRRKEKEELIKLVRNFKR